MSDIAKNGVRIKVERVTIDLWFLEVVPAASLYDYLKPNEKYSSWMQKARSASRFPEEYFDLYKDSASTCLFTLELVRKILNVDTLDRDVFEQTCVEHEFENALLSDADKYKILRRIAQSLGCEDEPAVIPEAANGTYSQIVAATEIHNQRMKSYLQDLKMAQLNS